MNLAERNLDRKGFKREKTIQSMILNSRLQENNIVLVAETGYFYNITTTEADISLENELFAEIKETTFLATVKQIAKDLENHSKTLATTAKDGHMSKSDKTEVGKIKDKFNKTGETVLNLNGYSITVVG